MRAHNILRQTSFITKLSRAQQGRLSAQDLVQYRFRLGTQNSFAISAMAFSTERSNTIGFIGLGAMGNHMVSCCRSDSTKRDLT